MNPYKDNQVRKHTLTVSEGNHSMNFFDSYGDGWSGGYWTITDASGANVLAGGPKNGVVKGAGGESNFCVGTVCKAQARSVSVPITVTITTKKFANEITVRLSGCLAFPRQHV